MINFCLLLQQMLVYFNIFMPLWLFTHFPVKRLFVLCKVLFWVLWVSSYKNVIINLKYLIIGLKKISWAISKECLECTPCKLANFLISADIRVVLMWMEIVFICGQASYIGVYYSKNIRPMRWFRLALVI